MTSEEERMMAEHRKLNPLYEGRPCAPLPRYPEKEEKIMCNAENTTHKREKIWLCCDSRKDECPYVAIRIVGGKVEYICMKRNKNDRR